MSLHRFARLRALIPLLAMAGVDLRTPEPVSDIGEAERVMRELAAAGISAPEVDHAAGGPENFLKVARVCLEMQAALRKLGIETVNVERLLLHDRMVRAQQDFGRRYGPLAGAGMALGLPTLQPVVQGLADYEARCAKEAALCGCGPAGVAQLDADLRGVPVAMPTAAETFAAFRGLDIPAAGTERVVRLGDDRSTTVDVVLRTPMCELASGSELARLQEETQRLVARQRGPGLQIRDACERARMSLVYLARCLHISHVEFGEYERQIRPVTPELWDRARAILPDLPGAMPPETARRPEAEIERERAAVDAFLHPAGRCTCGGGGTGDCEWCVMDRRREEKAARKPARKREAQRAKQARRRRTGRR